MLNLNEFYMEYYAGKKVYIYRGITLGRLIAVGWANGLCKEEVLID